MARMSDLATHETAAPAPKAARILVYSDDLNVRENVRFAVGSTTQGRPVEWTEAATHAGVTAALDTSTFDIVILDGEAAKSGGKAG